MQTARRSSTARRTRPARKPDAYRHSGVVMRATAAGRKERERMVTDQLPQVRYLAKRVHERLPPHVPLEDVVHAGILGLMDAADKYDPGKGVQFSTYAKFRIRGAMLDYLRELDWSPRELRRQARRLEQATAKLAGELGRAANEPELATEMEIDLGELQELRGQLRGLEVTSLSGEPADNSEDATLTLVAGRFEDDPFQVCHRGEMLRLLARAIDELPERERQILTLYYYEELTMKEVGAVLGVGESRVSQIHTVAVGRVRARLAEMLNRRPPAVVVDAASPDGRASGTTAAACEARVAP